MNKERKKKFKIRYFRVGAAVFLLVLIIFGIFLLFHQSMMITIRKRFRRM